MPNASATDYNGPFPSRLRILMQNTTQKELADYIGVSRQSISQYMDGSSQPVANKVAQIADYFKVSADYLLGRTGAQKPANINAVEKYGLSEKALSRLEEIHAKKNSEYFTRTVNALIEDGDVLSAIALFLYFRMENTVKQNGINPFRIVYKHGKTDDGFQWGEDVNTLGLYSMLDAMTGGMYTQASILQIEEKLMNLLENENEKYSLK
jgi:transcriptional regulator with XRE-family HTH domain